MSRDPIQRAEAWWALIARILTFFIGAALLAFVVVSRDERIWIVGVALTAMALPVTGIVRAMLQAATQLPPAPPPASGPAGQTPTEERS